MGNWNLRNIFCDFLRSGLKVFKILKTKIYKKGSVSFPEIKHYRNSNEMENVDTRLFQVIIKNCSRNATYNQAVIFFVILPRFIFRIAPTFALINNWRVFPKLYFPQFISSWIWSKLRDPPGKLSCNLLTYAS